MLLGALSASRAALCTRAVSAKLRLLSCAAKDMARFPVGVVEGLRLALRVRVGLGLAEALGVRLGLEVALALAALLPLA